MQIPLFRPQTEWVKPEKFPDLTNRQEVAIDLETSDPDLKTKGSGSIIGNIQLDTCNLSHFYIHDSGRLKGDIYL